MKLIQSTHEEAPDNELGRLAGAMLEVVDPAEGVTAIVMLHKDNDGLTALSGYDGEENERYAEAASDLFQYLKVLMEARGVQLLLIPMNAPGAN